MKVVYFTIFTLLFSFTEMNAQDHRREGGGPSSRENRGPNGLGNHNGPRNERRIENHSQPNRPNSNNQSFGGNRRNDHGNFAGRPEVNRPNHSQTNRPNLNNQGFGGNHKNDHGNFAGRPEMNRPNHRPGVIDNSRRNPIHSPNYGNNYSYGRPIHQLDHHRFNDYHYNNTRFYGHNGIYYRPWNNGYVRFTPPIGFSINILPIGAISINIGNRPSYFYEGIFYQQYNNSYQVIVPPVGTYVYALPSGCERIEYQNQLYYEFAGVLYDKVYYQGEKVYQVVGYLS